MLPVIWAMLLGIAAGWWPIADEALTALSAWDVLHGHAPVMGPRTTTDFASSIETHHPGPLLYYLLALPSYLAGGSPWGLLVGGALITALLVGTALSAARRAGGTVPAMFIGAAFLGIMWALGPDAAVRPFNPYPPAFATLTWLVLTWAIIGGHVRYLPHYVVTLSLMMQSHISYLPFVLGPVLALLGYGLVRWWRNGRRFRLNVRERQTWYVLGAILLAVIAWLPPLVELFRFSPNNLTQVWRYAQSPRVEDQIPFEAALRFVGGLVAPIPGGMTHAGYVDGVAVAHPVAHPRSVTAAAMGACSMVLVLMLAVGRVPALRARVPIQRRRILPLHSERDASVTALGGVLALLVTVGSLPATGAATTWNYLQSWPVVFFVWAVLLSALVRRAVPRDGFGRWSPGRLGRAAGAIVLIASCVAAFATPLLSQWKEGAGIAAALPAIEQRLADARFAHDDTTLHVSFDTDSLTSAAYIAPSIGYALHDDYAIHLPVMWGGREDTDFRKNTTAPEDAVRITIRRGRLQQGTGKVNAEAELVAYLTDEDGSVYTVFINSKRVPGAG